MFQINFKNSAAAESLQSCPTLCDPIDGSPPGSPVPGIIQARTLEWVGISFSNAWKWKVKVKSLSRVRPSATPWTAAYEALPSMGFSSQEYWSGVPLPSPKNRAANFKPEQLSTLSTDMCHAVLSRFSHVWLFVTLGTVARQVSLSIWFSRQEYWSGLPCPPPQPTQIRAIPAVIRHTEKHMDTVNVPQRREQLCSSWLLCLFRVNRQKSFLT